jgi:hypothetical protein
MPADKSLEKALADGSVLVEDLRGSARLSRPAPGVVLFVCSGTFPPSFYEPMVAFTQREMDRAGAVVMFVDGWELHSVATGFREAWTEWFKANKKGFRMHLLVRTKLMEMAASLANLFTGVRVIKTYSTYASWEHACRQDHPDFRHSVRAAG